MYRSLYYKHFYYPRKVFCTVEYIYTMRIVPYTHMSRTTSVKKSHNWLLLLPWTPQIVDINAINHVWEHKDLEQQKRPSLPSEMQELHPNLLHIWRKMDQALIESITDLMPSCVLAMDGAKGHASKY